MSRSVSMLACVVAVVLSSPITARPNAAADDRRHVTGIVRTVRTTDRTHRLKLFTESGEVDVRLGAASDYPFDSLVGATVRVAGTWQPRPGHTNDESRTFVAAGTDSLAVITPATPVEKLAAMSIVDALELCRKSNAEGRAKVRGVVTRYRSGGSLYISTPDSGGRGLRVRGISRASIQPGDLVEVVGFPETVDYKPRLGDATYVRIGTATIPWPLQVSAADLMRGVHDGGLVRLRGRVVGHRRTRAEDILTLSDGGTRFDAAMPSRPEIDLADTYRIGSVVELTGVNSPDLRRAGRVRATEILLRGNGDIVVLSTPSWWTGSRLLVLAAALGVMLIAAGGWIAALRRRLPSAERALRESEARYQRIFERSPAGNFVAAPDGRVLACNDTFARLLNFASPEAVIAGAFVLHSDGAEPQLSSDLAANGRIEARELVVTRRDGSTVPVLIDAVAQFDRGGILREFSGYLLDLTKQKQAEAALWMSATQLREAQKMEALGRLAGGIAHDFNNLLTVINGYTALMLQDGCVAGDCRSDLEQVARAGASAGTLTRQLLAYSRRQVLNPATIDLNTVVEETATMLRRTLGEDLTLRVKTGSSACVFVDRGQIEQVLMNLAVNARDAMPRGGVLTMQVRTSEERVLLTVSDTGTGISPDVLPHIFEPFYTTKPAGQGTGLGLATVYGIITQSGGVIEADSEPGRGTTFRIGMPRVQPAVEVPALPEPPDAQQHGDATILVVEDEPSVRRLVRTALERHGYRVIVADDSESAMRTLRNDGLHVDLMLSDIVMPRGNGVDLVTEAVRLRPTLKMILMSGYVHHPAFNIEALPVGVRFVQKPFPPGALVAQVREALRADVAWTH